MNIRKFWHESLASYGDTSGAKNVNEYYKKLAVAQAKLVEATTAPAPKEEKGEPKRAYRKDKDKA